MHTDVADALLVQCRDSVVGTVELDDAATSFLRGLGCELGGVDERCVDAGELVEWMSRRIEDIYGQAIPLSARHVYLSGRVSGTGPWARDPGLAAMRAAKWTRDRAGAWKPPPGRIDLLGIIATADGFDAEVRAALALRGLSLNWLAGLLGVSRQRLCRALRGPTMPAEQHSRICEYLGLQPHEHATIVHHAQQPAAPTC